MPPVIELRDVTKRYQQGATPALDGINLAIDAGAITAVMGPSGCGKSTLLNLISGLDRPTSGDVEVAGTKVGRLGESAAAVFRRRNIGLVFQFFNLLEDLTVRDNVAIPAQLAGVARAEAHERAQEVLALVGLASAVKRYPATLSGGERQRVAVARATINKPSIVLADEPTGALDSLNGASVLGLLDELNRGGQTIVLVTHDPVLAERLAHRIVHLVDGRIVGDERTARAI